MPVLCASKLQAAAFYLQEQGARGIGRANAGAAAAGDDASTIFFNPAGMTNLPSAEVQLGAAILFPYADFSNRGTTAATPGTLGTQVPRGGNDGGNPLATTPIPSLYAAYPILDKRLWFGIGINSPFGLELNYDDDWFGRYESTDTKLLTIEISPSIAYKINDMFSIGAGLNIQYADARLESRIPNPLVPGGPTPATDGRFLVDGDSWSVGFNLGATITPVQGTRIGLHYRYGIKQELDGYTRVSGLTGPLAASNGRTSAKADLDLPDIFGLGIAQQVTPQLTLLGQVNYFNWSSFNEIRIRPDNGAPDQVSRQDYRDSWSFAIGADYKLNQSWSFRGGFQYDETPTRDAFRSTRVPDGDRYWLAAGVTYNLSNMFSFDLSYAHVFLEDGKINRTDTFFDGTPLASSVTTRGRSNNGFDILALKGSVKF